MRVMAGWSGEMASGQWSKVEIELDETDLKRLLCERVKDEIGGDPWADDSDLEQARTADVFIALNSEAERLKDVAVWQRFESYRTDETRSAITRATAARDTALDRILGRSSTA